MKKNRFGMRPEEVRQHHVRGQWSKNADDGRGRYLEDHIHSTVHWNSIVHARDVVVPPLVSIDRE